ncbi:MAG: hypothetical protein E7556_05170 [Ruminococcaceae bacterium]|nr:hypothetical protein [Oscillospiraceae bacterium]
MKKIKNIVVTVILSSFILALSVFAWVKPTDEFSLTERRPLAKFPEFNINTLLSGAFMKNFENYTLDQFPLREFFRTVKAQSEIGIFNKKSNNDIIEKDGYITKIEYPLNENSLDNAAKKFNNVYEKYLKNTNTNVYFSIIPDKNYYLIGDDENFLSLDYNKMVTDITKKTGYMKYIDIFSELSIDSYYKTDSHWSQDKILPVAEKIAGEMGVELKAQYEEISPDKSVYGVYYGQYAINGVMPDSLIVLSNEFTYNAKVTDYQNNRIIPVYDFTKADGRDFYESFLGGPLSLVTIENENATTDKELVMFRDSFGSSLAPFFIEGYKKITLVDIRYIHPNMLSQFIEFNNQDVLFIYSTSVLNNSETLK